MIAGVFIFPYFDTRTEATDIPTTSDKIKFNTIKLKDGTTLEIIPVEPVTGKMTLDTALFTLQGNEGEHYTVENNVTVFTKPVISMRSDLPNIYNDMIAVNAEQTTLVIYPIFTANAYKDGGFYNYYKGKCDESCLKVRIDAEHFRGQSSTNAFNVLVNLGYEWTADTWIAMKPDKLKDYDRIILLHSEYVTKEMYDNIRSHPKVIYLYPNALYAEVEFDQDNGWIQLIKGHGYKNKMNAFDFPFDNSQLEYNTDCQEPLFFYKIDNGWMLNCFPESAILWNKNLLEVLQDI